MELGALIGGRIIPEDCVSHRKGRERGAQTILNYYKIPEKIRIKVLNSNQIRNN